jgi:hypothetical protein
VKKQRNFETFLLESRLLFLEMAMQKAWLSALVCAAGLVTFTTGAVAAGNWETTLKARDLNGDGLADAFFDTQLKVTWLANADAAAGTKYDDSTDCTVCDTSTATDGLLLWSSANSWAKSLTLGGVTGWRLPNTNVEGGILDAYLDEGVVGDPNKVELQHMYYVTLGLSGTSSAAHIGPFAGVSPNFAIWTSSAGQQQLGGLQYGNTAAASFGTPFAQAWAVHDGDIGANLDSETNVIITTAVPEPGTYALMLGGLAFVGWRARRRSTPGAV